MIRRRTVFFVSDSTAITAETLGQSLLTQFEHIPFDPVTLPFIDTLDKAAEAVLQIDTATKRKGIRPLVFSTLINPRIRDVMMESTGGFLRLHRDVPAAPGRRAQDPVLPYRGPLSRDGERHPVQYPDRRGQLRPGP